MEARTATPVTPLVLIIDIGSSSTRALLYDATATMVDGSMIREKSALYVTPDGAAEDDPAAMLQRVARCIDGVLAAVGPLAREIAAVGCATYASNALGLDEHGQPITPIYTYADTRSADAAQALRRPLDEAAVLQRTGCLLRTSYYPALFTWLAEADPARFRAVKRWSSVGEWLYTTFLGRSTITYSFAAWTGLLNRRQLAWDAELLAELPINAEQLGVLADVDAAAVGLREPWATRWPVLRGVPWFCAVGDGAAANLGSGCIDPHRIALSSGTSGALRVVLESEPVIPYGLWCYRVDHERPLLGGATSEGGNVLDWARTHLQLSTDDLDRYLLDPAGAAHGLTVLPFVAGERSPGWSGDVRATISGISVATTALDVARAALEGVTYRWALIAALLREVVGGTPLVVASGGGFKYVPAWGQLIADALGMPVALSANPETTSRGAALLALRSIGAIADLAALPVGLEPAYLPDVARHAQHQERIVQQQALYHRLYGGQA